MKKFIALILILICIGPADARTRNIVSHQTIVSHNGSTRNIVIQRDHSHLNHLRFHQNLRIARQNLRALQALGYNNLAQLNALGYDNRALRSLGYGRNRGIYGQLVVDPNAYNVAQEVAIQPAPILARQQTYNDPPRQPELAQPQVQYIQLQPIQLPSVQLIQAPPVILLDSAPVYHYRSCFRGYRRHR